MEVTILKKKQKKRGNANAGLVTQKAADSSF